MSLEIYPPVLSVEEDPERMFFREQRGGLAESMATVTVIERTRKAVAAYGRILMYESQLYTRDQVKTLTAEQIVCTPYGRDDRIGWDTYLLTSTNELMPVIGYSSKPMVECEC